MRPFRAALWLLGGLAAVLIGLYVTSAVLVAGREVEARNAAAPRTGRFVKAADVDLFVQEAGPPSGAAVLFIHAAGGWSETWRHSMTAAAERGFHAIAADLPPLGYSERPADGDYATQTQARRLIALLDALGVSRVTLVGHSFGSRTTVEVALLATERVRALMLVSAALLVAPESAPHSQPSPLLGDLLEQRWLRETAIGLTLSNPGCTRWIFERFVADPTVATDQIAGVYARPLAVAGTTRALGEWLPYFLTLPDTSLGSDRASYGRLRMPTLLVWGERDTTTPLPRGEYLKTLIPGSQLVVMKAIGHMAPQESPAAFDAILLDFLSRFGRE